MSWIFFRIEFITSAYSYMIFLLKLIRRHLDDSTLTTKGMFKLIRTIAYPWPEEQEEKTTLEEYHTDLIYPFRVGPYSSEGLQHTLNSKGITDSSRAFPIPAGLKTIVTRTLLKWIHLILTVYNLKVAAIAILKYQSPNVHISRKCA